MNPNNICTVVVFLSAVLSYIHMIYTADKVAAAVGYFVSLGILPLFIGGAIGCVGVNLLANGMSKGIKTMWWIPAIGSLSAILPVAYVLWRMS